MLHHTFCCMPKMLFWRTGGQVFVCEKRSAVNLSDRLLTVSST